ERDRAGVRAVDLHDTAARLLFVRPRAEPYRLAPVSAVERRRNREAAGAVLRHLGERRAAQASAGCEQRKRLEHVGLARAVFTHEQVELAAAVEPAGIVIAEASEGDPVERHGPRTC